MEILGYTIALLIGISLGLTGSGGSILMLPVLVYFFGMEMIQATTYSLFIVGITSISGVRKYIKDKSINVMASVVFGIPSLLLVLITRRYITPEIPEQIYVSETSVLSRHFLMMTLFALLMILASLKFIHRQKYNHNLENTNIYTQNSILKLGIAGTVVGFLTGLLGIGGGFLIVPALVTFIRLDIKKAVGTSLMLIAANSIMGLLSERTFNAMDWKFLVVISLVSIIGMIIGSGLVKKVNTIQLKMAFGWFILSVGVIIMLKEIIVYS